MMGSSQKTYEVNKEELSEFKKLIGIIQADLRMYGPIGFQRYWLRVQGYENKNLLKLIADTCFHKELDICAITSEEFDIPKDSVHDRFNYLVNESRFLPNSYKADKLDNIALIIEKENKKTIILNSQAVIVDENGERLRHIVIGSNQLPNKKSLEYILKYCQDKELIQIASNPYTQFGMGERRLEKYLDYYDAIEAHNSQFIIPENLEFIPIIGKYNKKFNRVAKDLAIKNKKPYIAVSDAHRIEDLGISYIYFNKKLSLSNGKIFINDLKNIIRNNEFEKMKRYEPILGLADWYLTFIMGISINRKEKGI